jgi:hypothetical protein
LPSPPKPLKEILARANKGRTYSDEIKKRMSERVKKWWANKKKPAEIIPPVSPDMTTTKFTSTFEQFFEQVPFATCVEPDGSPSC